jgi:Cohesin domain
MKTLVNIFRKVSHVLLIGLAVTVVAWADSRSISMPSYIAHPGDILEVPLALNHADGLAAVQVKINYDPQVLELLTVKAGPLGEAFDMSQGNGEGFVQLVFARAESLASGGGRLALLKFRVNAGAVSDLYSELAIAELGLSDSSGVVDLRQIDTLSTINGQVTVSPQANIDNANNGLPDWWEVQYELDLFGVCFRR